MCPAKNLASPPCELPKIIWLTLPVQHNCGMRVKNNEN